MITRAQDYQIITPVGIVNGGILPACDVAANGSVHVLRAENLDFAIEAVNERRGVFGAGAVGLAPSLPVRRQDWYELAGWLDLLLSAGGGGTGRESWAAYQSASFAPIAYTATFPGSTAAQIWPAAKVVERAASAAAANFPAVLGGAALRHFFYALQFADRYCLDPAVTPFQGSATYTDQNGAASTTASCAQGYFDAADERVLGYGYDEDYAYIRKVWGIQSATLSCTVPLPALVADACMVCLYKLEGFDDSTSGTWYFSRQIPLSVPASGVVSVPPAAWLADFDILAEATALGFNFPERPSAGIGRLNQVSVNTVLARLVVSYDFRTEIRSLNWQWTP
ncbi:MAG: hypothetical protein J6V72_21830 [Kiritimatiellae bacterium]|nr:hypothetical protein [Kiritimatiellia bacterium]